MLNIPLVTMLFIGVNLDFFIILLFLMQRYSFKDTALGYELGMLLVFTISAAAGQTIQALIPDWSIGFLGLIPIFMGVKGEDDDNDEATSSKKGIWAVMLIYFSACGADNIAVYVPVLATMTFQNIMITAVYFVILTVVSLVFADFVGKLPIIQRVFEKWGALISRVIYILIGIFVMFDTGLIQHLFALL